MHKNSILLIFALILMNSSCGQSNKKNIATHKTGEIMNNLKRFNYEPLYQIRVETPYNYEIRVNDIVVIRRIADGENNVININQAIFKSGKQELKIKVLPQSISREEDKEYLEQDAPFYVKIEETAWKDGSLVEPKILFEFELPDKDAMGNEIDYTQKKSFKTKTIFKAEIPYSLESWQDSKVFKSEDIEKITPKVLAFYEKIKSYHENQQGEQYEAGLKKGSFNLLQASYYDSIEAKDYIKGGAEHINKKSRPMAAIKDYKLELMGNGRLLGLVRTDGYNKGESVLRAYYTKNTFRKVRIDEILLHMPKGSDKFEVIWYMGWIKPVPFAEK